MILSQREKNIIGYVQHRAEQSVTEIARNLGLTESVVRRSLRRLTDESILVRRQPAMLPWRWECYASLLFNAVQGALRTPP